MSSQFEIIILFIWAIVSAETNYRQMFVDSSELCENTFAPKPIRHHGPENLKKSMDVQSKKTLEIK